MAETQTAEALSAEVKKQDYGIYNQGRIKLNFDEQTQDWKEQYEPVKGYKMFIPPVPKQVKLPTDVTVPTTPAVQQPTTQVTQPAVPLVQPRDGESLAQKQQREMMERFGPGQDPMQMAKTMSKIFTPGTEQYSYYDSMGALKLTDDTLKVNFDAITEKGGYGMPSLLGAGFKWAEKDIIEGTINKLRYAGILTGDEVVDTKGMYTFKVDQEKMNNYRENASTVANILSGGYRDADGNYIRRNDNLLNELGKLSRPDVDSFIADMAIAMGNEKSKSTIENALKSGNKGAAAALIAYQTGEDLDLDKKGLFGFSYYNQQFKDDYNRTLAELNKNVKKEDKADTDTAPTGLYAETAEQKKLLDDLDKLLKEREQQIQKDTTKQPEPKPAETPAKGTGASGPPGRDYTPPAKPTQYSTAGKTVSSSVKRGPTTQTASVKVDQAGRIRGGI